MFDHPTVEDFTGFLQDASRPGHAARNARILRHLLAECPACRGQLQAMGWPARRLERLVHLPGSRNAQDESAAAAGFDYANAFARADQAVSDLLSATPQPAIPPGQLLEELDRTARDRQVALVEEDERFASPRLVHWLIERSHEDRYSDPDAMLHWASVARSIATRCSPETLGNAAKTADLRARTWGQYGNALRVAGRLREASEAMITAQGYLEAGTGEPALHAKLAEQVASLHTFQRRFDAAIASLEEAVEIYRQLGASHALARTRVQQAIASLYAGAADGTHLPAPGSRPRGPHVAAPASAGRAPGTGSLGSHPFPQRAYRAVLPAETAPIALTARPAGVAAAGLALLYRVRALIST